MYQMDDKITSSIGGLFSRLHRGLLALSAEASKLTSMNSSVNAHEVREAREEIVKKLSENQGFEETRTLLKVLDLFSKDSAFIELVRDESKEWLEFLDTIEKSLNIMLEDLEGDDREIAERAITAVEAARKSLLRK